MSTFKMAVITFAVLAVGGFIGLNWLDTWVEEPIHVPEDTILAEEHSVLCIERNGEAETYVIPVPILPHLSDKERQAYYEECGRQFCESIVDDTEYASDVGIPTGESSSHSLQ